MTTGAIKLRTLMKMVPGRQIMHFYINEASFFDGKDVEMCEVRLKVGDSPVGKFDISSMKKKFLELIDSKKYKKFHIVVTRELRQIYAVLLPLQAWSFTKLLLNNVGVKSPVAKSLEVTNKHISNDYYNVSFNKDGTFNLTDKATGIIYQRLHQFEDWGDRGDEYTFGRLEPELVKIHDVKRTVTISGPVMSEIQQIMTLETFLEIDPSRQKRIGKTKIPVKTIFRFYNEQRIDIQTTLSNSAKDHRLRICFDLPFKSEHTLTSTHFGFVKRRSSPIQDDSYIEQPSGIQPQKRFIRVEDPMGPSAVTLINQGLPEVELVRGSRLALTLMRSIGWLSRSDIPERPEHAGPFITTPGAQELGKEYTFNYSLPPKNIFLQEKKLNDKILKPLIQIYDPNVRISSIRVRNGKIWITMFNMTDEEISTKIQLPENIIKVLQIKLDGSEKDTSRISEKMTELIFKPHEIKICTLE
jgi:alpha-mannosidase